MTDLLKITLVFAFILLLLRKKINIGLVMLIAATLLIILYQMSLASVISTVKSAVANEVTIKLTIALSFIRMFELILREHDVLTEMMNSVKTLLKNRKIITISMPLLIGLIPSVGGAYFSAPMVADTTRDVKMSPEEKGFINYWFRHPWEFILPLYPGILLASAISKIELHSLIKANLPYAILIVVTGFIFAMHGLNGSVKPENALSKNGLWSFFPISAVLLLVVLFHIELHYALIAAVLLLLLFYRYKPQSIFKVIKHGVSPDVIVLILGVMFFKEVMEHTGAVRNLSLFFPAERHSRVSDSFSAALYYRNSDGPYRRVCRKRLPSHNKHSRDFHRRHILCLRFRLFRSAFIAGPYLPCAHKRIFQGGSMGNFQDHDPRMHRYFRRSSNSIFIDSIESVYKLRFR